MAIQQKGSKVTIQVPKKGRKERTASIGPQKNAVEILERFREKIDSRSRKE